MKSFLLLTILLYSIGIKNPKAQTFSRLKTPVQGATRAAAQPSGSRIVCGDLLQQYATKPAGVMLIGCRLGKPGGQTVAVATYKVFGANSVKAEAFFHEHYGMGNLVFACCGWGPANGKFGQVESARLRKLNSNYSLLISMYSDAQEIEQAMLRGETSAWRNKRKVKQFIIEVTIVDV